MEDVIPMNYSKYASEPWFPSSANSFTLFAAITHDCNLKCAHCFATENADHYNQLLNDDDWMALIDQLALIDNSRLFFTGGEPLVHPSFIKLAKYASEKDIPIIIGTNATLIDKNMARNLRDIGVNEVRVSIDGSTSNTHDFLRGEGALEKTKIGVKSLVDIGIPVICRTTIYKNNYNDLESIAHMLIDLKIIDWELKNILPSGRATINTELMNTTIERNYALESVLKISNDSQFEQIKIKLMEGTLNRNVTVPKCIKVAACPAGIRMMVAQPNGNIVPCGYLSKQVIGNVKCNTLVDVRERWAIMEKENLPSGCQSCKNKDICKGGCRAFNFCNYDL
jgi:radical SAM protein with 4Fe4S-binding SPASM domain